MMDGRIRELLFQVFCESNFLVTLLNGARFLSLMLEKVRKKGQISQGMSMLTSIEEHLYLYAIALMGKEAGKEKLNDIQNAVIIMLAVTLVKLVQKALDALTKS